MGGHVDGPGLGSTTRLGHPSNRGTSTLGARPCAPRWASAAFAFASMAVDGQPPAKEPASASPRRCCATPGSRHPPDQYPLSAGARCSGAVLRQVAGHPSRGDGEGQHRPCRPRLSRCPGTRTVLCRDPRLGRRGRLGPGLHHAGSPGRWAHPREPRRPHGAALSADRRLGQARLAGGFTPPAVPLGLVGVRPRCRRPPRSWPLVRESTRIRLRRTADSGSTSIRSDTRSASLAAKLAMQRQVATSNR